MKQKKLNFTSAKRTASASDAKKAGNVAKIKSGTQSLSSHDRAVEVVEEDSKTQIEKEEVNKRISPRTTSAAQKYQTTQQDAISQPRPELNPKDVRWRKLIVDAKEKRAGLPLGTQTFHFV
jgi:hypothetical protein